MNSEQIEIDGKKYVGILKMSVMLRGTLSTATTQELKDLVDKGIFSYGSVIRVGKRLKFLPKQTERDIARYRARQSVKTVKV